MGRLLEFDTSPKKGKKTKKKVKATESEEQLMETSEVGDDSSLNTSKTPKLSKKKKSLQPQPDEDDASEEERWLEAIEAGKDLEDVDDELKKIKPKDPKLMTARQRAMYEKNIGDTGSESPTQKSSRKSLSTIVDGVQANVSSSGELLLALPNFKVKKEKEKLPLTAEDIEKSKEKAQKRKQLADEKREKDKKKTMDRLLKKQDSKMVKQIKARTVKQLVPVISYRNDSNGAFLNLPPNFEFPLKPQKAQEPPQPKYCGIAGCKNLKKYSCSKTNIPLCSLECFKKNVESVKQMIF